MLPRRVSFSSAVFILCCLLSSARLVYRAPRPGSIRESAQDIPRRSDQRFAELKKALPARGVVGYVGDPGKNPDNDAAYYLTQYALAPLVVDRSPNHPLVVGNFPELSGMPQMKLQVLKDFGGGVFLFAGLSDTSYVPEQKPDTELPALQSPAAAPQKERRWD